jgi:hypothetical protein
VLAVARDGGPWLERFQEVIGGAVAGRRYDLTARAGAGLARRWLAKVASADTTAGALAHFLDPGSEPIERFGAYVRAAEQALPTLATPPEELTGVDPDREAAIAFGSLLNFAAAPIELPVVRPDVFDLLEKTLGYEWTIELTLVEQYERHLAFAADVHDRLEDTGVPVRDMLDVQSLIQSAGVHADFWAADPRTAAGRSPGGDTDPAHPYLAICAIYRDAAHMMREWIEFHKLVGVEHFFLYNNFSKDGHRELLAPYVQQGTVTVRDWPVNDGVYGQMSAYDDCLRWRRYDARWIAFIDLDEFLFSPTGKPLPEILAEYEPWPAVAVNWVMFGTGGLRTPPPGLVIENYVRTVESSGSHPIKSIVDPTRTVHCIGSHHFQYAHLGAVDENHFPVDAPSTRSLSHERLRVNHYHWKSWEEYVGKIARKRAMGRHHRQLPTDADFEKLKRREERGRTDETVLAFLPALRERLGGRQVDAGPPAG